MTLYLNQIEALQLAGTTDDRFVYRVVNVIHNALSARDVKLQPSVPFDLRFYSNTSIAAFAASLDHTPYGPILETEPANGINFPDLNGEHWVNTEFVKSGFAQEFFKIVRLWSTNGGRPFDVGFASEVLRLGISASAMQMLREARGLPFDQSRKFDNWIEGFVRPTE